MHYQELYMQRSLQLAALGQAWVAPNPMVGAVVVKHGVIIGEGYHQQFGGPHAEVNAVNAVSDKTLLEGATIYVSLEPCAHFGKTPPCTDLIIAHKIAKVIVACLDPNPLVAGKGVMQLQHAGIEVEVGVLEKEAKELNKKFFYYHLHKKPYIILKWAQTADGLCGREHGSVLSKKITNWFSNIIVHQLRSTNSAILVGYNTALYDNPALTNRKWYGKHPLRIVIDMEGKLPARLNLFTDELPTIVFTCKPAQNTAQISYVQINKKEQAAHEILAYLYNEKIQSLLIEGGPKTLQLFINSGAWNEAHIFTSSVFWGQGVKAPVITKGKVVHSQCLLNNTYKKIIPENSL